MNEVVKRYVGMIVRRLQKSSQNFDRCIPRVRLVSNAVWPDSILACCTFLTVLIAVGKPKCSFHFSGPPNPVPIPHIFFINSTYNMVLPYLRNPRRRLQNQKQYHLEPDHTNTYDTSTYYKHVGRRTKGGRGGGFRLKKTGKGDLATNHVVLWIYIGVFCLYILVRVISFCLEMYSEANYPQEQQQPAEDEDVPQEIKERKQLIRSKLHYEFVLSDGSNIKVENLRGEGSKDDVTEASDDDDIDNDSVIVSNHIDRKANATSNGSSSSSSSSVYMTAARNIRSNWRLQPRKKDVCSICLFRFHPGQTICVAKDNRCCNRMFHETCLEAWLMDHDYCPLCQQNVME